MPYFSDLQQFHFGGLLGIHSGKQLPPLIEDEAQLLANGIFDCQPCFKMGPIRKKKSASGPPAAQANMPNQICTISYPSNTQRVSMWRLAHNHQSRYSLLGGAIGENGI